MVQHARKYISRVKTPKCLKSHLRACKKHGKKALSAGRETGHRAVHNSKIVELSVIQKQRLKQNCFSEDVRKSAVFHVASIAGFQVTVIFKWSSLPCKPAQLFGTLALSPLPMVCPPVWFRWDSERQLYKRRGHCPL